jgi:ParB-like chromosome segregation protein Spo0J
MALLGAVDLEVHQLDLRYQGLRRRSARKERAVLASLAEIGQQTPVVVVTTQDEQRPVLLDGYKRVRALKQLRTDCVVATNWTLPEPDALLLERLMRAAEVDSALEQGWLLRELCEGFGLSLTELSRRFDKTPSWVSRRLALVRELPESIQERVRSGELQAHAAMKHMVPLARANRAQAEALAEICGARQLSTREVGVLCSAFRSGTAATRALILQSPDIVLRAQEQAGRPKEPMAPQERLLDDFGALMGIARRVTRLLRDGGWPLAASEELERAAQSARAETERLFDLCQKEFQRARPESENRHP